MGNFEPSDPPQAEALIEQRPIPRETALAPDRKPAARKSISWLVKVLKVLGPGVITS
jgi:hypothetical protein